MNEKERNMEIEIDIGRLVQAVMRRAWLVVLVSVLCASIALGVTHFGITPKYKASTMFYVNNSNFSVGDTSIKLSSSDLVTSRGLVDSYIVILKTRETLNEVIECAGSDRSVATLNSMISAGAVNETEIFHVTVTSEDPAEAELLANAIGQVLPERIGSIIEGSSAKVVDWAVKPSARSSPSYTKNVLLGFLLGIALSVGLIIIRELMDTAIRGDEDIAEICEHPVLATVPDLTASSKGGYEYRYDRQDGKSKKTQVKRKTALFGKNISFTAAEAYKLLRTKIQFSFADEGSSRVIGISSSLSGEGKSLTSVNLAYSLAQLGKKVILIDCDMRRPTLAEKLKLAKHPGLSNCLTGQAHLEEMIQTVGFAKDDTFFHAITAGQNPPNPVELLSSTKMENLLGLLKSNYDYIILDLPPVGEVSDAMAVAKNTDGILMVVRQNVCDRYALSDTVRQFEFIEARILGIVYNCVEDGMGNGYYKYKKYYKGRYKKYGYGRYYRGYYRRGYYRPGYYRSAPVDQMESSDAQETPDAGNEG